MKAWIKTFSCALLLLCSSAGLAESICKPLQAKAGEPDELIIHEEEYSYSNVLWAYANISKVIDANGQHLSETTDYKSTANSEIVLKGYILRSNCLIDRKSKSCEEFCTFMKKHRYWYE